MVNLVNYIIEKFKISKDIDINTDKYPEIGKYFIPNNIDLNKEEKDELENVINNWVKENNINNINLLKIITFDSIRKNRIIKTFNNQFIENKIEIDVNDDIYKKYQDKYYNKIFPIYKNKENLAFVIDLQIAIFIDKNILYYNILNTGINSKFILIYEK